MEGLPPQCAAHSLPLYPILQGWQSQTPGNNDSEGEEEALAWVQVLLVVGPWLGHCLWFSLSNGDTVPLSRAVYWIAATRPCPQDFGVCCVCMLWAWGELLAFIEKYFAPDLRMSWMWSLFP